MVDRTYPTQKTTEMKQLDMFGTPMPARTPMNL